jgi:hypothetical protein
MPGGRHKMVFKGMWTAGEVKILTSILFLSVFCFACEDSVTPAPIQSEKGITAAYKMAAIDSLVKLCGSGLMLYAVSSLEVTPAGTSSVWYYDYLQTRMPRYPAYRFHATYNAVGFLGIQEMLVGLGVTLHNWMDSDIALALAEDNGGRDYRSKNPDCTITPFLTESEGGGAITYWAISYHASNPDIPGLRLVINGLTGEISK